MIPSSGDAETEKLCANSFLQEIILSEYSPSSDAESNEQCLDFIRDRARTSYHPVGTCKMGEIKWRLLTSTKS